MSVRLARAISIVLHPFVLIPLSIAFVALRSMSHRDAVLYASLITVGTIVPVMILIALKMRSGEWTNFDVSVREQRPQLYIAAFILSVGVALIQRWMHLPPDFVRGTTAACVLIALGALANLRLKLSLHCAFAAFLGCSFLKLNPIFAITLLVLVPLLAWSRVFLRRHTTAEVIAGTVLGGIVGLALTFWRAT